MKPQPPLEKSSVKAPAERMVKDIRRQTRRHCSAEDKIRIAQMGSGDAIEIWGDGLQTRSFLYVDECLEGTLRLTRSADFEGPVNIGSDEVVTINQRVDYVADIAGKKIEKNHIPGPTGVRGRNSENRNDGGGGIGRRKRTRVVARLTPVIARTAGRWRSMGHS